MAQVPHFDPGAQARRRRGGWGRGSRLALLVVAGVVVATGGWIGFQKWLGSWRWDARADTRPGVIESKTPPVTWKAPEPEKVALVRPLPPVQHVDAPAPPRSTQPAAKAPPKKLPTAIAFNGQVHGEPPGDWFVDGRRPMIAKGCALRPGVASAITAVLNTTIESEVPGQVLASVVADVPNVDGVIDPRTGRPKVLLDAGTNLVGIYDGGLDLGSRRMKMAWTEAMLPGGRQVALADANGMDVAGSMGVGGTVTTAWGQVILTAAIFSLFDAGQAAIVPDGGYANDVGAAATNNFARTGQQVIKQMLGQPVKIKIPAGTLITVSVAKTVRVC